MTDIKKAETNGDNEFMTAEELAAEIPDVEYDEVTIGKRKVRIGSLTAEEVAQWRETISGPGKNVAGIRLVVQSLVDAKGNRIGTPALVKALQAKSNAHIEKITNAIVKLNGMTEKALAETKNV